MTHTAKKLDRGKYEYRGYIIRKNVWSNHRNVWWEIYVKTTAGGEADLLGMVNWCDSKLLHTSCLTLSDAKERIDFDIDCCGCGTLDWFKKFIARRYA